MPFEIPYDLIRQVQIALREEADLSTYEPDDPSLPSLPSPQQTLAKLDPSPGYLRCKHCEARLLRGIQSLICVFCGRDQSRDPPPEPLNFRNTFGCRWLLESLDLDGSEMVTANESSRQHAPKDEFPLSDLLSLEVKWSAESEIVGPSVSNETLIQSKSSLNLAGVDLDNFFADGKRDAASSASEEQLVWNRQIGNTESNDFQVREKLSLFENIQPSETVTRSIEDESGDSFSGWEANFQSADSGTPYEETKSLDPFVGNESEISAHLDTFFGPAKDSSAGIANDNMVPSASMNSGWFQDDIWGNSDLEVIGRTERVEMTANVEEGRLVETTDNYSSTNADWLQVDLGKTNSNKAPDNKTTAEDDDSLDSWNDFTSSTSALDPSNGSWDQTINHAAPSVETSEIILVSSANNSQDMDFGRFSISDFLSVGTSNANGASEVKGIPPEASTSDRMLDAISKFGGDNDDEKGGVVSSARIMPSSNDVESLLSQMKDLSFMLESNLAIPQKRDGFNSSSHD